jgi:hypothetical protein
MDVDPDPTTPERLLGPPISPVAGPESVPEVLGSVDATDVAGTDRLDTTLAALGRWVRIPTEQALVPGLAARLNDVSCVADDFCMAVGSDLSNELGAVGFSEVWDGSSWTVQATAPRVPDLPLNAVSCTSADFCVAVGYWANDLGTDPVAEVWDGTEWTFADPSPTTPDPGYLEDVSCSSPTWCVAVGNVSSEVPHPLIEEWDGSTWSPASGPPLASGGLDTVSCPSDQSCLAMGSTVSSTGEASVLVEVRGGDGWHLADPPAAVGPELSRFRGISCVSDDGCIAVGTYVDFDPAFVEFPLAEEWDGSQWTALPIDNPAGLTVDLSDVDCTSLDDCVAVGHALGDGPPSPAAETWDGVQWTGAALPVPDADFALLAGVSCLATSDCVAVGGAQFPDGRSVPLSEQLTSSGWVTSTPPNPPSRARSELLELQCFAPRRCIAVGRFVDTSRPDEWQMLVQAGDRRGWRLLEPAMPDDAIGGALRGVACVGDRRCLLTGYYDDADGIPHPLAEVWDGTSLSMVRTPGPAKRGAYLDSIACATSSSCVAVGGQLRTNGMWRAFAERWNGTKWRVVATGRGVGSSDTQLTDVACPMSSLCVGVGWRTNQAGRYFAMVQQWHGGRFTIRRTPRRAGRDSLFSGVSCSSASACTAVGRIHHDGEMIRAFVESSSGRRWRVEDVPLVDDPGGTGPVWTVLNGVSCTAKEVCVAVGQLYVCNIDLCLTDRLLAMRKNHGRWMPDSIGAVDGVVRPRPASLNFVTCRIRLRCTAVGAIQDIDATQDGTLAIFRAATDR